MFFVPRSKVGDIELVTLGLLMVDGCVTSFYLDVSILQGFYNAVRRIAANIERKIEHRIDEIVEGLARGHLDEFNAPTGVDEVRYHMPWRWICGMCFINCPVQYYLARIDSEWYNIWLLTKVYIASPMMLS